MRELRNVVERALSLGDAALADLGDGRPRAAPAEPAADEPRRSGAGEPRRARAAVQGSQGAARRGLRARYLTALLARHHGNISRAAAEAGIDRNYIHRLVKKYGLEVDRT